MIKKNLIIINGTMGVGKTVVSKMLNEELHNSIWLDGDWCWMMKPFIVNEETKSMVIDNIVQNIRNFLNLSHIENVIFNWVMDQEEIYDTVLNPLKDLEFNLHKFTLVCSDKVLIERINKDIERGVRDISCINRSLSRQGNFSKLNTYKIDTDNNTIEEIVRLIKSKVETNK